MQKMHKNAWLQPQHFSENSTISPGGPGAIEWTHHGDIPLPRLENVKKWKLEKGFEVVGLPIG